MELRHLKEFLTILETGSMGVAARRLGLSQPALSKSVRAFEVSLGGPIFARSVSGTVPTAIGMMLEPHARSILNQAAQAQEEIALRLGAKRSRLGIIAGPMFTEGLFPHVFQRFNETHPDVEIVLKSGHFESHLHLLRSGEADLGFFIFDRPSEPDLAAETLMEDQRVVVVAGVTHPLATRRRVSPQQLWEQAWVLPDLVDHLFGTMFADCFARFGLPAPKPACELDTAEPQIRLIERGTHLGILSELVARDHVRAGRLCVIRTPDIYWPFASRVLYRRGVPLSSAAQHFLDIARVVSHEKAVVRRR